MINRITLLLFIGLAFLGCEEDLPADCAGVAGGSAVEDNCGVCDDNADNDCTEDCAGVWGGDNICGCTVGTALNYNPEATFDDGSCEYAMFLNTIEIGDYSTGYSVKQTQDGNYILSGEGESSNLLVKVDINGEIIWYQTYPGEDGAYFVQETDDDGFIVTGSYDTEYSDLFMLKTDSNGNTQWINNYGGEYWDIGYSVIQATNGEYIAAGISNDYLGGGDFRWDLYVVKTSSQGSLIWSKTFNSGNNDYGYSVVEAHDGGYIVVGRKGSDAWIIKLDTDGNEVWSKTLSGTGTSSNPQIAYYISKTNDGGYIIAGQNDALYNNGRNNGWLIKINSTGETIWEENFGSSQLFTSVMQDSNGGYIVAGFSLGTSDYLWLVKVNSDGSQIWEKKYRCISYNTGYPHPRHIQEAQVTSDGGYIAVSGKLEQILLIKTDPEGNTVPYND